VSPPGVAMVLIARDEEANVEPCFASFWDHVDEVVLVDTGSTDGTVAAAEAFAEARGEPDKLTVGHFEWVQDFAAARAYGDSLTQAAWRSWADLDDIVFGAEHLRRLAAEAPPDLVAMIARYDYAQDERGNCICQLRRERLVRAGHGTWQGRVHEAQAIDGAATMLDPSLVEWQHRKGADTASASNERNLKILRAWVKDDPAPRQLMYLGTEEFARGRHKQAIRWFRRYLRTEPGWDEERAQVHRKLSLALAEHGDHAGAIRSALDAVQVMPAWPDSALTLAESYYQLRQPAKAIHWANEVLRVGVPDTLLIVNPTDYELLPHVILAGAHAALGDLERAVAHAEHVLQVWPDHPALGPAYAQWRAVRKRDQTAQTFLACAEMLAQHDEQLKALEVLRSVPVYAVDHPAVVARRSELRERLDPLFDPAGYAERYRTGATKPEDLVSDDRVMALGDALPRAGFLLAGLREQAEAA
jgi:tetratricopeptide (TPR) repeat protein